MKRVHFIAIGGAAMHNLAIALKEKGIMVTGSDDEIFEPSYSRLAKHNLLPAEMGWKAERINSDMDGVILGMHARKDNPELIRAREINIPIYSYPEFLYQQTKDKRRAVIAGSHGKTTITAMVIHVLRFHELKFDYMVGSKIDGFENMVGLENESEVAVFEGDEYLSSPIDLRPKFMHYKPDIALVSGIEWDHINVFPTLEIYIEQFSNLLATLKPGTSLIYYSGDKTMKSLVKDLSDGVSIHSYDEHPSIQILDSLYLETQEGNKIPLHVFGKHNLQNINGARLVCFELGISNDQFYKAISSFNGTAKRLQVLREDKDFTCYLDFAHSPSKVKATVNAVREKHADRKFIAILELNTFSSLNRDFIPHYKTCLDSADEIIIFFNQEVLKRKKMDNLTSEYILQSLQNPIIRTITKKIELETAIRSIEGKNEVLLLMSSGNFGGIEINSLLF